MNKIISIVLVTFLPLICCGQDCGVTTSQRSDVPTIANQIDPEINMFPWMVSIQEEKQGSHSHICGGTIINEKSILTAAHCFDGKTMHDLKVVYGTSDLDFKGAGREETEIEEVIIHPKYVPGVSYFDVAIAKPRCTIVYTDTVRPICLPQHATANPDERTHHFATIAGWGSSYAGGQTSKILKQSAMTIFASTYCNSSRAEINSNGKVVSESDLLPNLFTPAVFCAGVPSGVTGLSCGGDSGGPLSMFDSNSRRYVQLGVVSGGECGSFEKPTIFGRLEDPDILNFILDKTAAETVAISEDSRTFYEESMAQINVTMDQLLEKFDELQLQVEETNKEVQMLMLENANLKNDLNKSRTEVQELNHENTARKNDINGLKSGLKTAHADKSILDKKIDYVGDFINTFIKHKVMFSAYSSNYKKFYKNDVISYNTFHVDHGSNFNLASGTFTAPIKGTYSFSFHGRTDNNQNIIRVEVQKDDSKVAQIKSYRNYGTSENYGYANYLSYSWSLDLNVGQTVRLKVIEGVISTDSDRYAVFNGELVRPI